MKKIFLIICLLFFLSSIAQTLENVKKQDTLYILFDDNVQKKIISENTKNKNLNIMYMFDSYQRKTLKKNIIINYSKYYFDKYGLKKMSDVKIVKIKKIKNKLDCLIDQKFFNKYDVCDIEILLNKKVLYLFEYKKNDKKNKITLYEVLSSSTCYREG